MSIEIKDFFSGSDVGCVRKANEDNCDYQFRTPNGDLFVVCDGMGGHVGGATASKIAVNSICSYLKQQKYDDPRKAIADAIEFANIQILATAEENTELKGMGTTACVLLVQNDNVWIAHCGDSRIYLYCNQQKWLHRVTKDHSLVQSLVDCGEITDAEAENHPQKNRILKALGIKPDCRPEVCTVPIQPAQGDIFLICSDGLSGMLTDTKLQEELQKSTSVRELGANLIEMAKQEGGTDNITVQLICIADSPHRSSVFVSKNPAERKTPSGSSNQSTSNSLGRKWKSSYIAVSIIAILILLSLLCWYFTSHTNISTGKHTVTPVEATPDTAHVVEVDEVKSKQGANYIISYWQTYPRMDNPKIEEVSGDYPSIIDSVKNVLKSHNKKNYKYVVKGNPEQSIMNITHRDEMWVDGIVDKTAHVETDSANSPTIVKRFSINQDGNEAFQDTIKEISYYILCTSGTTESKSLYYSKDIAVKKFSTLEESLRNNKSLTYKIRLMKVGVDLPIKESNEK